MNFDVFSNDKQYKAVINYNIGGFNHFCTGYELYDFSVNFYEKDGSWGDYKGTENEPVWFFELVKKKLLKKLKKSQETRTLVAFYRSDFEANEGGGYTERGRILEAMLSDVGVSHVMAKEGLVGEMSIMSLCYVKVENAYEALKPVDPTSKEKPKPKKQAGLTKEAVLEFMEGL